MPIFNYSTSDDEQKIADYTYLILANRRDGAETAILKVSGDEFSILDLETAIPQKGPSGDAIFWSVGLQARRGAAHFPGTSNHRHQNASSAPAVVSGDKPTETTASAPFFVSVEGGMRGRKVPGTRTVSASRRSGSRYQYPCCAGSLPPYAAPLLGRSLSGSQLSRKRASSLPPLPLLGTSSAWLNLVAIPPDFRRGKPRRKSSGRPGSSRTGCLPRYSWDVLAGAGIQGCSGIIWRKEPRTMQKPDTGVNISRHPAL